MCLVTWCKDPCTGKETCTQDYLLNWEEDWKTYDCKWGIKSFEKNCTMECSYTDCSADNNNQPCWIERCEDGCDGGNCTVWFQQGNDWFGDECKPKEVGLFDNVNPTKALGNVISFGKQYEDSVNQTFEAFCAPGDASCKGTGKAV